MAANGRSLWEFPYVNLFKQFGISKWSKCCKAGDVQQVMDQEVRGTVYKVSGSVPAGNYIQFPGSTSQSLSLKGQYVYFLLKPVTSKYFMIHLEVATEEGILVRVSVSNLFKEFKSTGTWLQFPFVQGKLKKNVKWTIFVLDLKSSISDYLSKTFAYLKSVKVCANVLIKNIFTSHSLYSPFEDPKMPNYLPKELSFFLPKNTSFGDRYKFIVFPQSAVSQLDLSLHASCPPSQKRAPIQTPSKALPWPVGEVAVPVIVQQTSIPSLPPGGPSLPPGGPSLPPGGPSLPPGGPSLPPGGPSLPPGGSFLPPGGSLNDPSLQTDGQLNDSSSSSVQVLDPPSVKPCKQIVVIRENPTNVPEHIDPLLVLSRVVGCEQVDQLFVTSKQSEIVYSSQGVVVAMETVSRQQRLFLGHTDRISALSLGCEEKVLVSGQMGSQAVIRIWDFLSGECLAVLKVHHSGLHCLSLSKCGTVLCGVGLSKHNRNMIVLWNTSQVLVNGAATVIAKCHVDVDVEKMKMADFDPSRLASCGSKNIRIWRVKGGNLRSSPVDLKSHHNLHFSDVTFQYSYYGDLENRFIFASSRSGCVIEVHYQTMAMRRVWQVVPSDVPLQCLRVHEDFAVTGSGDGILRIWTLDFSKLVLEVQFSSSVTATDITQDGLAILAGTDKGSIGLLNAVSKEYSSLVNAIGSVKIIRFGTSAKVLYVGCQHSVSIWSTTSGELIQEVLIQQGLLAFSSHPRLPLIACGLESGEVWVFNTENTADTIKYRALMEGKPVQLEYSLAEEPHLYVALSDGAVALYDAHHSLIKVVKGVTAARHSRDELLVLSQEGHRMAVIGPQVTNVSIFELLRGDIQKVVCFDVSEFTNSKVLFTVKQVLFAPNGHLMVLTNKGVLLLFHPLSGEFLSKIHFIENCCQVNLTPKGDYLICAVNHIIKIWPLEEFTVKGKPQVFIGHQRDISKMAVSSKGQLVTLGEYVVIWDLPNKETPLLLSSKKGNFSSFPRRHIPKPEMPNEMLAFSTQTPYKPFEDVSRSWENSPSILNGDFTTTSEKDRNTSLSSSSSEDEEEESVVTTSTTDVPPEVSSKSMPAADADSHSQYLEPKDATEPLQEAINVLDPPPGGYPYQPTAIDSVNMEISSVFGYTGQAKNNVLWQPHFGFMVYSCGNIVLFEEFSSKVQSHLTGHHQPVYTMALNFSGDCLASASKESEVFLWNLRTKKPVASLSLPKHTNTECMSFSRDDRFLLTSGGCMLHVWETGAYLLLCSAETKLTILDSKWNPFCANRFTTVGRDSLLLFWTLCEDGRKFTLKSVESILPKELARPCPEYTSHAYGTGELLYVGTDRGEISVWSVNEQKCLYQWKCHSEAVSHLLAGGDCLLMTATEQGSITVWKICTDHMMNALTAVCQAKISLESKVVAMCFDDLLEMGLAGTSNGSIVYVNWTNQSSIPLISGHSDVVSGLKVSKSTKFVTSCLDGTASLWKLPEMERLALFSTPNNKCTCVDIGTMSPLMVCGYSDGSVRIFAMKKVCLKLKMKPHNTQVTSVIFASNDDVILSSSAVGSVAISSSATGTCLIVLNDHKGHSIKSLLLSSMRIQVTSSGSQPLTPWLISCEGCLSVWGSRWKENAHRMLDWQNGTSVAAFHPEDPDLMYLATSGDSLSSHLCLYNYRQQKRVLSSPVPGSAGALAVSPSSGMIGWTGQGIIHLFEGNTLTKLVTMTTKYNSISSCIQWLNEHKLLTSHNNLVILWKLHLES